MFSRNCDSSRRKARPEPAPAEPAANSATTAAISARPPAILQAGEEIGQRVRQLEQDEGLPAAGAVELEQVEQVVIGRAQALRGVGEDREEGDEPGADQERRLGVGRVDEDQRRDGDDRRHLQDDGVGIERQLDPFRLGHEDGERDAADQRDGERQEGDLQRDQQGRQQDRIVGAEGLGDAQRARQDVVRHMGDVDIDLPDDEQQDEHADRYGDARDALAEALGGRRPRRLVLALVEGRGGEIRLFGFERRHRVSGSLRSRRAAPRRCAGNIRCRRTRCGTPPRADRARRWRCPAPRVRAAPP